MVFYFILFLSFFNANVFAESYYYKVYFGIIPVGIAKISVQSDHKNKVYVITSWAKTIGVVDLFYKVRDKFKSIVDGSFSSFLYYKAKIREGGYRRKDKIIYNPATEILIYYKNGKLKRKEKVKKPVYDLISAYFVFSRLMLSKGIKSWDTINVKVTTGKKEVIPIVRFLGKGKLKTRIGIKNALKFSLKVYAKGLLVARDPKKPVIVWFDADKGYLLKSVVPTRWGNIKIVVYKLDI